MNRFKNDSEWAEDVEIASIHRVLERLCAAQLRCSSANCCTNASSAHWSCAAGARDAVDSEQRVNWETHQVGILRATAKDKETIEGVLGFAERVLPRAAGLWVQASLEQRRRPHCFPGSTFDRNVLIEPL